MAENLTRCLAARYSAEPGMTDHGEVTELLHAYAGGDRGAFERVVTMVYNELRRIARNHLRRTKPKIGVDTRTVDRHDVPGGDLSTLAKVK